MGTNAVNGDVTRSYADIGVIYVDISSHPSVAYATLASNLAPHRVAIVQALTRAEDVVDAGESSGGVIWIQHGGDWSTRTEDQITLVLEGTEALEGTEIAFMPSPRRLIAA